MYKGFTSTTQVRRGDSGHVMLLAGIHLTAVNKRVVLSEYAQYRVANRFGPPAYNQSQKICLRERWSEHLHSYFLPGLLLNTGCA